MKDLMRITIMIAVIVVVFIYRETITNFVADLFLYRNKNNILTYNEYYRDQDFLYVQNTDNNVATNYQDVLNIFYTIINSGDDLYSFTCDYDGCISDVKVLIDEENIIAEINNFVSPYNSFQTINVDIIGNKKVTVKTRKIYNEEMIELIENYINEFIERNITDQMSDYDKILKFHDYVVNNTIYDANDVSKSYTAYSLIKYNKAICGGYSDIMALYLDKLGIRNYRITSDNHVWNLLYLDNKWLHLDATWDDPVASDGKQYLIHNFFLIDTNTLLNSDQEEHNYNNKIYLEAN